ncbi:MAG: hypothetical protein HYZ87_04380, partial [Candidatus Omnitrophica bacterium]|nr:hypothetical protein [Candidatus Omnitrophota bacterium]
YTDFIIEIFVDGVSQGTANIKASDSDWQSSEITLKNLEAGDHTISLRWQNDFYVPGVYDANLKLKNLSFNEIAPARASPLLADASLFKTITYRGSTTAKRSETLFTGDKNEEKQDRSFLYDYTGGIVKSTSIFTYNLATRALESSIVYRGHVTGSAPTDPAQKRSAAFYAGDVEGEEILNTVQTYSRGLVLDTTRYYYGDSLLPASDPGAWDAPLRKTSTFRRETTTLKSETTFLGEKGDEKTDRTFTYNRAGDDVKSTTFFDYDPTTKALLSSIVYREEFAIGTSAPTDPALRRSAVFYTGDEGEEIANYSYTYSSLGNVTETTYSFYEGAGGAAVRATQAAGDSALVKNVTYARDHEIDPTHSVRTSESFFIGDKGSEILNYVVAYSQDSQTQTNLPSQTTFYYYGEKNSTDATQWVRASAASGGDVLNQVVVLSGDQSALSNGLDALLIDATWLAAQPSLSIRRDFVYGAEDQVTEFRESGFTGGYSNYYEFRRYNMVEIDDNLNRYDEDGTDRSGDNTYHVEMRNMLYDGDDRLIHSEKLEYPPSASGTVTALDLDNASLTVSDITYVQQGGTEYAYVDVVTRALSPGAITLSTASTRFRVDGQSMTDATIDPTPAVAVDAARDARLGRTTTTYALTEEEALAFNLRELLTNNGFDFFANGTATPIHSSNLSDGAGLFPAVNSWFDNLIAAIGAGFIQVQASGATYKIKIASVSDQTVLDESYDGLSNLLRQVTEYATGVGVNRVVSKTSIVENTYATVPGSAVKVLRSSLTTDYYGVYNAQAPTNAPNRILKTTLNTYNITAQATPTDANVPVSLLKSSVTTTYLNPSDPAAPQTIRSIESSTYTYRSYADSADPLKTRYEIDHESLQRTGSDNVTQTYTVNYQRDPNGVLQYKEVLDALGDEASMPEFYSWTQDILDELS